MEHWSQQSKEIQNLEVEICYLLSDKFFKGNPNNRTQIQDETQYELIQLPTFNRVVDQMARTSEVEGNESELGEFYKVIAQKAKDYHQSFNGIRHYFWLRLWFWHSESNVRISFPWYDTFSEMQRLFQAMNTEKTGLIFEDLDQGWGIEIEADEEFFYIRLSDSDTEEEYENIKTKKSLMLEKILKVEERAIFQIKVLTKKLGADVWTKYIQNAKFIL